MIYRDEKTKALINSDVAALNKYKLERNNQRKIDSLCEELTEVKSTLSRLCAVIEKLESK
jgi:hypothetical protein